MKNIMDIERKNELEWLKERLSAYCDGELSDDETLRFERLLPKYAEVAESVRRLKALSRAIRDEAQARIPANLDALIHDPVMGEIRRREAIRGRQLAVQAPASDSIWKRFFASVLPPFASAVATAAIMYFLILPHHPSPATSPAESGENVVIIQRRSFLPSSPYLQQASSLRQTGETFAYYGSEIETPRPQFIDVTKLNYFFVSGEADPSGQPIAVVIFKPSSPRGEAPFIPADDNRVEIESLEPKSGYVTVLGGGKRKITIILVEDANLPPPPIPKNAPIDL
ncbi:MAG: hypothetical protein Kow0090_18980 [Myxococcota bacterium]